MVKRRCLRRKVSARRGCGLGFFVFAAGFLLLVVLISSFGVDASLFDKIFGSRSVKDMSVECWLATGNYSLCNFAGFGSSCIWSNNSGAIPTDPYCSINSTNYNSVSLTMWINGTSKTYNDTTGGRLVNAGCCIFNGGGGGGGGMILGCGSFNGNRTGCLNSSQQGITGCAWEANDANQNSWCAIKSIGDWMPNGGTVSASSDIGCCEMQGCWTFRGTQTPTNNCTSAFGGGVCGYQPYGGGCPETEGCCSPKSCLEVNTSAQCSRLSQMGNPCSWSDNVCSMAGGGGFNMYNDTSSCMNTGGWWNGTACQMPGAGSGGSGGGGFMFAQEARCWFGDQNPSTCRNVSGCVYCNNQSTQLENATSACYLAGVGKCQGHEPKYSNWNGTVTVNVMDINTSSMSCGDLRTKQLCICGPMPNCAWANSSTVIGQYCSAGLKSDADRQLCMPPVKFCEDTLAKNNATLCNLLASNYMMPCKWENSTTPAQNCTFNNVAIFGSGTGGSGGGFDYSSVGGETSCIAAGGTWRSEYYFDSDGSFKSDGWCEKGALVSLVTGQGFANKGNCDVDCWACEFQANGTRWTNETVASAACRGSAKGICQWKSDNNAPNRQGYCDYPKELMYGGAKDCGSDCKACEFMGNATQAQAACSGSPVGCSWTNDTNALNGKGGYCMASSKKSCLTDCFSCYSQTECSDLTYHPSMNCSWDSAYRMCKPFGFTGEICFNAQDDDNDGKTDCADSDCTYDMFCGGGSIGSGSTATDCKKKIGSAECSGTVTSGGRNCTWTTPSWGGQPYCDYPGADCWMFDTNATVCRGERGCIYRNATGGYLSPSIRFEKNFTGFCDVNKTKADICYNNQTRRINATSCAAGASECEWVSDAYAVSGGRCEFKPLIYCGVNNNATACNAVVNVCLWKTDSYSSNGGFCEPICRNMSVADCNSKPYCAAKASTCEPEGFGGMEIGGSGVGGIGGGYGCHMNDGNQTACALQNMSCSWNPFSQNASQGICNPRGEQMMMAGMDMSPPKILGQDGSDVGPAEVDIKQFGIKDSMESLSFGIMLRNITNAAVCKGYYVGGNGMGPGGGIPILGSGNATTKFHWFMDTNKNITDGCNATTQTGQNLRGFEFLIKYVTSLSNLTVSEQKSFMKCVGGSWVLTNVPLTSNRQMLCGMSIPMPGGDGVIGGVMLMVDKENLESFSEYNRSTPMRVFVSSANATYSETNPLDSPGAVGYYTSGTADFKFVDCGNPASKNDEKCKNFNKFGFNVFEDCKNGVDDDSDGFADCADMKCSFTPMCSGGAAFNFTANENDHESPMVTFSNVEAISDGAFIKFDSNEPANGSVEFYGNDSSCSAANLNATVIDLGDSVTYDDYKPFHMTSLDLNTLAGWTSGLMNGTMYYYKTLLCDTSSNCATSACQNFTTKTEVKSFIFKLKLPPGYNVSIKGGGGWSYNGNFTTNIAGRNYETGVKVNTSVTRNINVTVNCGNQSLMFVGVDVTKPKSIDLNGAFVCDTNSTSNVLGMNSTSKAWSQAASDLGLGGANDYINLAFPITYDSGKNVSWCNDELTNCTKVNEYANCSSGGTGKTNCRIPTSLGFSVYQIVSTAATPAPPATPSSGGGGGGGGAAKNKTTNVTTTGATGEDVKLSPSAEEDSGEVSGGAETGQATKGKPMNKTYLMVLAGIVIALVIVVFVLKKKDRIVGV